MSTAVPEGKDLLKLKKMLKSESHRWFQLGIQLRLSMDVLRKIEKDNARNSPEICFLKVLQCFLDCDPKRKWKLFDVGVVTSILYKFSMADRVIDFSKKWDIFDALGEINKNRLKKALQSKYKPGDPVFEDVPINELVNLLKDATPDWFMFGQYLEIPTTKLQEFRDEKGADQCLTSVIDIWMEGNHATYETVIEALENVGNRLLARKVREEFLLPEQNTAPVIQEQTWLDGIDRGLLSYEDGDAGIVIEEMRSVVRWEELGLALKIKQPKIDEIRINRREQVETCRLDLINEWLRSGHATWEEMCKALYKIDHQNLAKKIADNHRVTQATPDHPIPAAPSSNKQTALDSPSHNSTLSKPEIDMHPGPSAVSTGDPILATSYSRPIQATGSGDNRTITNTSEIFATPEQVTGNN